MKIIELDAAQILLDELLEMARQETVILQNEAFMIYLDELFSQEATISLEDVEKELGL